MGLIIYHPFTFEIKICVLYIVWFIGLEGKKGLNVGLYVGLNVAQ
jgi:hypothetical protein